MHQFYSHVAQQELEFRPIFIECLAVFLQESVHHIGVKLVCQIGHQLSCPIDDIISEIMCRDNEYF